MKAILAVLFALVSTQMAQAQWTHAVQANAVHNQDISFSGVGPKNVNFSADLYGVKNFGSGFQQTDLLEQDTGNVSGGGVPNEPTLGNYLGTYKRNEQTGGGNWNYIYYTFFASELTTSNPNISKSFYVTKGS